MNRRHFNLAAAAGAFGFGHFQDRLGHKLALGLTLLGWIATCLRGTQHGAARRIGIVDDR